MYISIPHTANTGNNKPFLLLPLLPRSKIFKNPVHPEFGNLRVIEVSDELWFVGKEIAETLGYKDTAKALRVHVDSDDKRLVKVDEMATFDIKSNYGLTIRSLLSHPQQQASISKKVQTLGYSRSTPINP